MIMNNENKKNHEIEKEELNEKLKWIINYLKKSEK